MANLRLAARVAAAPIPSFGLGLAALGRPAYLTIGHGGDVVVAGARPTRSQLENQAHAVIAHAWARGLRYFDAARSYGLAEAFLGGWLAANDIAPQAIIIGSKWGYRYTADWNPDADTHEVKDHSPGMLDRQLTESRDMLGDHLALYQIHSATIDSGVLEDRSVLARLAEIAASGVAIGISTSGPTQRATIERALDISGPGGGRLFSSVQSTWNLLEPSAESALAAAHDAGLFVIVKEALANGRLTDRDPVIAARLRSLVPSHAPDAVALAAAVGRPWADIVLSGATTVAQLDANLKALEVDDGADDLPAQLAEPSESYWRRRSTLSWT